MKKRIGKFFIILGVIFFCLTPFYSVHGEDYYHYNVFNILDSNGRQIGSAEYVLYQDFQVAHERSYVSELTINFAAYYRGSVTISRRTYQSDYIIVEGASISSGSDSSLQLWLAGSNYVHVKWYSSADFNTGGYYPADVFVGSGFTQVELSPGESRQDIIDALDTSNGNWTSLLQQMNDIKNLFGTGSDIQNVDVDSIRGMLNTIRSEILAIGVLDGVIATKVGELSGIADNIELLLEQIGYIAANVQVIADSMDLSDLENAITDLETAINNLSGNFNITNNIDITNVSPLSMSAYLYFSQFNGVSMIQSDFNYPAIRILSGQNNNGAYLTDRKFYVNPHSTFLLAFIVLPNIDITANNFKMYNFSTQTNSISYSDTIIGTSRLEKIFVTNESNNMHSVSFDLISQYTLDIIPVYLGDVNAMSTDTQQLVQYKIPTDDDTYYTYFDSIIDLLEEGNDYVSSDLMDKLDDVITAIDHISLNVDYNEVNTTVNNFNVDINTVHNTETNILNSFNTYRQRFNTGVLDSTDWFSPTLFHYLFNNIWTSSNSHIGWIITLILFCVLIVAVLGLRK